MESSERRDKILLRLSESYAPLSAGRLAEEFGVSRQIIVGDIALIRAAGTEIDATPRGYLLGRRNSSGARRIRIACIHERSETETELNIFVDNGCFVLDTIVEHPVYGELIGVLNIKSRFDVKSFITKTVEAKAPGLSELTGGLHLHTVEYTDEEALGRCIEELSAAGFIYRNP